MRYFRLLILLAFILLLSPTASAQMPVRNPAWVHVGPPWFEGMEAGYTSATINAYNYYGNYWFEVIPAAIVGILHEGNVIYTSKLGNDANPGDTPYLSKLTIQAAITQAVADGAAINNRFVVYVYPGVYAETLVFGDYVDVIGLGVQRSVQITGVNENPLVTLSNTNGRFENCFINMAPTASNATAILSPSGSHALYRIYITMTSATNDIECRLIDMNGGNLSVHECRFQYEMTGTSANAQFHQVIDVAGTSVYRMRLTQYFLEVNDVNDTVVALEEAAGAAITEAWVYSNVIEMELTNVAYAGTAGIYYAHGNGPNKQWRNNHLHISSAGNGTGYCYVMNTVAGGDIHSLSNDIIVEGFANNWYANVAAGDTLGSHFDDINAAQGWGGAGAYNMVTSPADGYLYIDGQFQLQDGSEAAGDILQSNATGVATWVAPGAGGGTWGQLAEATEIVAGAGYTRLFGPAYLNTIQDVTCIVTCRSINGGVVWHATSHPCPVADFVTYCWVDDGAGNMEFHVSNDSQMDIEVTVSYADL